MPRQTHARQKSDDSKLAFELQEVETNLSPENVTFSSFSRPKISSVPTRIARTCREAFLRFENEVRQISTVNLTVISIVVLSLSVIVPISLFLYAVLGYPINTDISLQSFQIPTLPASMHEDAYRVARRSSHRFEEHGPQKHRRSAVPMPDPLASNPKTTKIKWYKYTQFQAKWNIDIVYLPKGEDKNMFTVENLLAAHRFEQSIMNYPGFFDFCWKWSRIRLDPILSTKYNACAPTISMVDFFFPTHYFGYLLYDGQGQNLTELSMKKTLRLLLSKPFTYWFVDKNFSSENPKTSFLRAQIKFGFPLRGYNKKGYNRRIPIKEQDDKFTEFMKGLVEFIDKQSNDKIKILYGGPQVFDHLIKKTVIKDVKLAQYPLAVIIIFMFVLTSFSFFLTFFGIVSISLSPLLAYFLYRVPFEVETIGILSGVSLFVIIGIGVDDVFVFINTFIHARHEKNIGKRLFHVLRTAGGATFFTSFTTAAAFGANCLSKIPAIHDFGLFMMLLVVSCWFQVLIVIPPTLFLWHQNIRPLERKVSNAILKCLPLCHCCNSPGSLPDDIERFLAGNPPQQRDNSQLTETDSLGCDVDDTNPLFSDNSNMNSDDNSDMLYMSDDGAEGGDCSVPLLLTLTGACNTAPRNSHSLLCNLQYWLFYYCKPVAMCRFALLVLYVILLGGSLYMDSNIKASDKPPAFFRRDTNLQQLLDLQYNMSNNDYNCKICHDIVTYASNLIPDLPKATVRPTTKHLTTVKTTQKPMQEFTTTKLPIVLKGHSTMKATTPRTTTKKMTTTTTANSTPNPDVHLSTPPPKADTNEPTKRPTTPGNSIPKKTPSKNDINTIPPTTSWSPLFPGSLPDPCPTNDSCKPAEKPILGTHIMVNVVLGIKGIDRSRVRKHVIADKGNVTMDPRFTVLYYDRKSKFVSYLCQICKAFADNKELVRENGAQCFPQWFWRVYIERYRLKECEGIKKNIDHNGQIDAAFYWKKMNHTIYKNKSEAVWMYMSFESTTSKNIPSHDKLKWYLKWDAFLKEQIDKIDDPAIESAFQASQAWVEMYMEVIAVNGSIYGIAFSLFLCLVAVIIFTGHLMLSIIAILTILGVLCLVVAIFYLLGWEIGAIEAISLSILVGTSVDYCVHLIDGFIIAGRYVPSDLQTKKDIRKWRTSAAVSHIGSSILSSAMTTIAASIPLFFTTIQLFAKFGQILAINTAISIVYTLTFSLAFLMVISPARYRRTWKSMTIALVSVGLLTGMASLCLYIVSLKGTPIPGPGGNPLFKI